MRRTTIGLLGAATAALLALAPSASAAECEGGATAPAKRVLHGLEGPLEATPAEGLVHAAECALP